MSINVHIRFVLWTTGWLKTISLFLQAHLQLCGQSCNKHFFRIRFPRLCSNPIETRIGCSIDRKCALDVWWGHSSFTYPNFLQKQWWMNVKKVCWLTLARFRSSFTATMLFKKMKAFFLWNKFSLVWKFSNFNFFCFFAETLEPKTISPKTIEQKTVSCQIHEND